MPSPSPANLVEQALATASPFQVLLGVARQLRDKGMLQPDLAALYDSFRERHASDTDETRYNAILDVMDFIAGFCSPSEALYPDDRQFP